MLPARGAIRTALLPVSRGSPFAGREHLPHTRSLGKRERVSGQVPFPESREVADPAPTVSRAHRGQRSSAGADVCFRRLRLAWPAGLYASIPGGPKARLSDHLRHGDRWRAALGASFHAHRRDVEPKRRGCVRRPGWEGDQDRVRDELRPRTLPRDRTERTTLAPVWRRGNIGRTWVGEPGHEWGAGFVFPEAGCWRIRVGPRGDVWLLVRS